MRMRCPWEGCPVFLCLVDFALAYASLSPDGRAFLRKQRSGNSKGRTPESVDLLRNRSSRLSLIRSLKTCDAVFAESVPESVCAASGRRRSSLYPRFVPFAWISLEIWMRLLAAYGISPGRGRRPSLDPADFRPPGVERSCRRGPAGNPLSQLEIRRSPRAAVQASGPPDRPDQRPWPNGKADLRRCSRSGKSPWNSTAGLSSPRKPPSSSRGKRS